MRLMTVEYLKSLGKQAKKHDKKRVDSKKLEYRLELELTEKLETLLETNDRVMFEVSPHVLNEFLNMLNGKLLSLYDYEQVAKNKFVFMNKDIEI